MITYSFIFKPEEVAEEEISISQCYSGITFLEIVACRVDQVPHLQNRLVKKSSVVSILLKLNAKTYFIFHFICFFFSLKAE